MSSLLSLAIFLPLALSLPLFLFDKQKAAASKLYALVVSLLTFGVAAYLFATFDANQGFQFQQIALENWFGENIDIKYFVALDGTSILLFTFSAFMFPLVILGSWNSVQNNVREHLFFLLALETCILGVFSALDIFLYYLFWETMLIPMLFLIGIWGNTNKSHAATKFFIYMLTASLLLLVGILYIGFLGADVNNGVFTTDYTKLLSLQLPLNVEQILFWLFGLSFFAKAPLFPLHSWLPDVYAESPVSAVVTGILLKMATYALIRFNVMLFPTASASYASLIAILSIVAIIYGAAIALVQTDMRRVLAYSSISHLGFLTLGIFAFTHESIQGAIIQMVGHGLSTGLLFLLLGFLYERRGSTLLSDYGGLKKTMPLAALFFSVGMFASIGLPGLNGFIGEFLILTGAFKSAVLNTGVYAVLAAIGVILSAVYMLPMFQKLFLGTFLNGNTLSEKYSTRFTDLTAREFLVCAVFALVIVWIGIAPNVFMKPSEKTTAVTVARVKASAVGLAQE
jgi:NADH-quinone oxidoreductase subunit M